MLVIDGIQAGYGKITALHGIRLEVRPASIVGIIGPNGAGKTTLCRTVSGVIKPRGGSVSFEGQELAGKPPRSILQAGIAQVPEDRQVFPEMSVRENLQMGAFMHRKSDLSTALERIYTLFPVLADRAGQSAGHLSGGEQQMLAIGRGLMARPRVLILDEPSHGLAPNLVDRVGETLLAIANDGVSVLLVEQNLGLTEQVAEWIYVLEMGRVIMDGPTREVTNSDAIRQTYLGI